MANNISRSFVALCFVIVYSVCTNIGDFMISGLGSSFGGVCKTSTRWNIQKESKYISMSYISILR